MRQRQDKEKLLSGPITGHVIRLAVPMIIAFTFITAYIFVDRFWVSKMGDAATAAIGAAFVIQMVIISISVGIGSGVNSYIARNIGADDEETAANTAKHGVIIALALGVLLAGLGIALLRPFYATIVKDADVLNMVIGYLTIILLFTPVNLLSGLGSSIFQGYGDTVTPMWLLLIGNILNMVLDPFLILGFGTFSGYGIEGAAYATVIGRLASMMFIVHKMFIKHKPVRLSFHKFKFQRRILKGILQVGFPSTVSQLITSVGMTFIFFVLKDYGDETQSAYTIVLTYEMVIFLPTIGIANAVSILTGHNFGASLLNRVNKTYYSGILVAFVIMSASAVVILINPQLFAGLFAKSENVLSISSIALSITAVGYMFNAVYLCSVASFQGLGMGNQYLFANIVRLAVLVCAVMIAEHFLALNGVWIGLMSVNIVSALVLYFWYRYIFNRRILTGKFVALK